MFIGSLPRYLYPGLLRGSFKVGVVGSGRSRPQPFGQCESRTGGPLPTPLEVRLSRVRSSVSSSSVGRESVARVPDTP